MNVTAKPNPTERRASAPPQGAPAARFVLVAQGLVILAFAVGLSVEAGLPPLSAAIAVAAIVVIVVAISKLLSGIQAEPVRRQTAKRALKLATAPVVSQPSLGQTGETGVAIVAGAEDNQSWSSDFDFAVLDTSRPQLNTPRAELSPLEAAVAALPATAPVPNAVPPPLPSHAEPAPTRLPPAAPLRHDGRADRATNVAQNPAPASQAPSSMAADYWSFRPSQPRFEAPATPVPPVAAADRPCEQLEGRSPRAVGRDRIIRQLCLSPAAKNLLRWHQYRQVNQSWPCRHVSPRQESMPMNIAA